jgi:hypothetical protein
MTELRGAGGAFDAEIALMARTGTSTVRPPRLLSASYVLELRQTIREDAYNSADVADEVARRLLRSGDL